MLGDWDRGPRVRRAFRSVDPDVRHYLEPRSLLVHGGDRVRTRRRLQRRWELRAFDARSHARDAGDSQLDGAMLAHAAWLVARIGRHRRRARFSTSCSRSRSRRRCREAADYVTEIGWLGVDLERDSRGLSRPMCSASSGPTGDLRRPADDAIGVFDASGRAATEAVRPLRSLSGRCGGDDPEPWLAEAESFYRGVRATRYLREIEELRRYPPQRLNDDDVAGEVADAAAGDRAHVEALALQQRRGDRRSRAALADRDDRPVALQRAGADLAQQPVRDVRRAGEVALVALGRLAHVDDLHVRARRAGSQLAGSTVASVSERVRPET